MNKNIDINTLKNLGLSKREIQVYLHLLKSGVQSIKQISQATGINRTTVYRYTEPLVSKGLAEWIIGDQGKKVQAASPENLKLYLENKKSKFENLEKRIPQTISILKKLKPQNIVQTHVKYFEEEKGIRQMIWNTLETRKILRSYTPFGRRNVINTKWEDKFEHEWKRRKLKDKIITNETNLDYIKKHLVPSYKKTLDIRIISSKKYYITTDIAIYNDVISIISFEKDNLVGVEIENKEMAKTQKSIFDIVWEVAKPLET